MNESRRRDEFQELILRNVETLDRRELGRGAYGRVYEVEYCGETYAAKEPHILLVDGAEGGQQTIQSFLKECRRCSKLRHPNIVQFLGVYYPSYYPVLGQAINSRLPVMVMERMACNLTSFVTQRSIPIKTKFSIITDVACGLNYLHNLHPPMVHRDLTPNNILMANNKKMEGNVAKIADFGVSKVIQAGGKNTMVPGHIDFMPPEAHKVGPANYNCSLDIFSFAGIILHTFTQQWPTPSNPTEYDTKTGKINAFTEKERRMKYINLMMGEAGAVLRPLIEECLDMNPDARPSITTLQERINYRGASLDASLDEIHLVSS